MKQKLLLLLLTVFSFTNGFSQTTAYEAPDIHQCGWEVFDLTQQTPIILGDQDPQNYVVSYHLSLADAENNTNAITNPMQFVGQQEQTIFARVSNLEDDTFDVTDFHIGWSDWEDIPTNQIPPVEVCDDNGDGIVYIDLTSFIDDIVVEDPSNYEITFHFIEQDLMSGNNPIANPQAFSTAEMGDWSGIWMRIENPETGCYTIQTIYINIIDCTNNTISGTLTADSEGNGCESGGTPAAYVMVALTNGDTFRYTYTDADGNYTFYNVPDGDNGIEVMGQGAMTFSTEPGEYIVTAPGNFEDKDFCLTEPEPTTDAAVFIYTYFQPRPGFEMSYMIVLQNFGNTTESGTVTFTYDDAILSYNNSAPVMTASGNTLTLAYSNLEPYTPQYIYVNFTVFTPPTVEQGDILTVSAVIDTPAGDIAPENNEAELTQTVTNSQDPNDIACREGESITEAQADDYLHYTIRFQNEATGPGAGDAIFVVVDHDIDSKFDLSTFQPISASHDYTMRLEDGHLTVRYDDINLPPADVDEEGSNGYFMYRIKPKSNVQLGDIFEAQASIVFDFNAAIVTNNYMTTIENIAGIEENNASAFVIYPNPASGVVNVHLNEMTANEVNVSVTDITGKTVIKNTLEMNGNSSRLDISALNSGMYFITLQNGTKTTTKKMMIK